MKTLTQFIKEEANNLKKTMENFAEFLFDKQNDEKSEVPQLLDFCKKVFEKKKDWDEVIHYKNSDLHSTLVKYIKTSNENNEEFQKLYNDIIKPNFSTKNINDMYATYTMSHNDYDVFVHTVFFALRYINQFKNVNLLEGKK